ncbi:MAG: hypothetical protein ABJC13_17575 [Acidobacteriota bacterium]
MERLRGGCPDCLGEVVSPFERRYRYPFASCSRCTPALPPRSAQQMCVDCRREFENPNDRHFEAPATACHRCGPRACLSRTDGAEISFDQFSILDDVDAVATLIQRGEIVAVRDMEGFRLLGDALRESIVETLAAWASERGENLHGLARDLEAAQRFPTAGAIPVQLAATALEHLIFRRLGQPVAVVSAGSSPGPLPAYTLTQEPRR